jgi:hypothetical protein
MMMRMPATTPTHTRKGFTLSGMLENPVHLLLRDEKGGFPGLCHWELALDPQAGFQFMRAVCVRVLKEPETSVSCGFCFLIYCIAVVLVFVAIGQRRSYSRCGEITRGYNSGLVASWERYVGGGGEAVLLFVAFLSGN